MRIAVIGGGVAGLVAARALAAAHAVTLYEAEPRLGGHAHTVTVEDAGVERALDTGFLVFNPRDYPRFSALLDELGVASRPTTMSFSVRVDRPAIEYSGSGLAGLFAQPANLARPAFLRMALDLARFFHEGRSLVGRLPAEATIDDLARAGGFGRGFVDWHLLPLGSALWSAPPSAFRRYPARFVMEFLARHDMLEGDLARRVAWRTIVGGSARYVAAIADRLDGAVRRGERVLAARRGPSGVRVRTAQSDELFDQVVFACHGDEALALLENPTPAERAILGAVRYQPNDVVLHTDTRLLPRRERARAAWNYHVRDDRDLATVTYDLNRLQGFASRTRFLVTLNEGEAIDPALVLRRWTWSHPQASAAWARARADFARIQGADRAWFCGAWLGNGFHEDGVRSAEDVARGLAVAVAA